jgi:3-oxoacyl-[acyl-carrier protein] reductase
MDLSGKTALVTGAAGAIGASIAQGLVASGARVYLLDIAEAPLLALSNRLNDGAKVLTVPRLIDLGNSEDVSKLAAEIATESGGVDILINNAGILSNNKMVATPLDEWRRVHAINVDSAFLFTQAFLPKMREKRWGRIINMSSYAAKSGGLTAGTAYSVSKSAMIGLTFSTARETAGDGITANAIAPAYVMSPMISEQLTETQRQNQLAQIPVGRFCTPEEITHTTLFLASPLAGFITGEVIDMNGGLHFD